MAIREVTDAQRRAVKKHDTEKVDKVTVRLPKGCKNLILKTGDPVNQYVIIAVIEQMKRDGLIRAEYRYGMRLRGFSPGCQPKEGFIERRDDKTGKYYDILVYDRILSDQELADYELDYICEVGET